MNRFCRRGLKSAALKLIMQAGVPYIVAQGRKGGSNVAAAIINALLYQATGRTL